MNDLKTTDAQRRASKKYDQKNTEGKQYRNKKSATKNFILNTATDQDLELVQEWLNERLRNTPL